MKNLGTRFPGSKPAESGTPVEAKPDGHVEGKGANEISVGKSTEDAMGKLSVQAEKA